MANKIGNFWIGAGTVGEKVAGVSFWIFPFRFVFVWKKQYIVIKLGPLICDMQLLWRPKQVSPHIAEIRFSWMTWKSLRYDILLRDTDVKK